MDFTSIHNYYEHLVIDYLRNEVIDSLDNPSTDYIMDIACYALTKLPARYVRHEIDMAFYLSSEERLKMVTQVKKAVDESVRYISENFNKDQRYDEI